MMYSFHKSDLRPGAPRVLPAPLIPAALFLGAGLALHPEIDEFLSENGVDTNIATNRWYFEVWYRGEETEHAASASYVWDSDQVVCEAITVEPAYASLNMETYLDQIGHGIWGQSI
ncbi:hypothetical protein [uncultured Roseobacter sp.]|uniref:hypothetical protein n=1 Tax=uncultured Roseobacter sp. TaxID=114847 RepID=UPI0026302815|nr:hypothetical protein [uncultured Roseobacter sp.]